MINASSTPRGTDYRSSSAYIPPVKAEGAVAPASNLLNWIVPSRLTLPVPLGSSLTSPSTNVEYILLLFRSKLAARFYSCVISKQKLATGRNVITIPNNNRIAFLCTSKQIGVICWDNFIWIGITQVIV